jgi:hypothetical protein
MSWRKLVTLFASILIGLSPWYKALLESGAGWSGAFTVESMAVALPTLGGIIMAWLGSSPRFPMSYDGRKQF